MVKYIGKLMGKLKILRQIETNFLISCFEEISKTNKD